MRVGVRGEHINIHRQLDGVCHDKIGGSGGNVDLLVGLRVTEEEELTGLDISQHEEVGYAFAEGGGSAAVPAGYAGHAPAPATIRVPQGDSA